MVSGVPTATMAPPSLPPSGPGSTIQSAAAMTSRLYSMTTTVFATGDGPVDDFEQTADGGRLEAGGRLVHNVDVARPRQLGGELEALRFAAGEGGQRRRAGAGRLGGLSRLQESTASDLSDALCRYRDYADIGADDPAGMGVCAKDIGIITGLREKPGAYRRADSGRLGPVWGWSSRAHVPSARGRRGGRCRWCGRFRVRATGR